MSKQSFDETVMATLLQKAERMNGLTDPNPMVAAAVYHGLEFVSEGVHQRAGAAHAEVIALDAAGERAKGATLYITLEPCTHHGRTSPCVDAIIRSGIQKVIYAMSDPNPKVQERSADDILQAAGIEVVKGILEDDAMRLNAPFIKLITTQLPYVSLKVAMSIDGKISEKKGVSTCLSSEASLQYVHRLRSQVTAILVGIQTILVDDPSLTVRHGIEPIKGQPDVMILDSNLKTPLSAKVILSLQEEKRSLFIFYDEAFDSGSHPLSEVATLVPVPRTEQGLSWSHVLQYAYSIDSWRLLIEGGQSISTSAFHAGVIDEFLSFIVPVKIGDDGVSFIDDDERAVHQLSTFVERSRKTQTMFDKDVFTRYMRL